jgi:hypothetical protein
MRLFLTCVALMLAQATLAGGAEPALRSKKDLARQPFADIGKALKQREFTKMVTAICQGSDLGPGEGWFKPSQGRYDWNWLADRFDANRDGKITRKEFTGPPELFDRLDRDRNGVITQSDLDWSDASPWWGQMRLAGQIIRKADQDGDRKLSKAEWDALFKELSKGKETVNQEDLRALLFPPPQPRSPSDMPSRLTLLSGLLQGELGSASEGPRVGQPAPDFTLPTHEGKKTITLSSYRGHKPVVLIFGSFT